MSGLLLAMVLSVRTCWFHITVTLSSRLGSTDFGAWSYHCLLSDVSPISFHMSKCSSSHNLSHLSMYRSLASIGHVDMIFSAVSSNCLLVYTVCTSSLFLIVIFLLRDIRSVVSDIVLLLLLLLLLLSSSSSSSSSLLSPLCRVFIHIFLRQTMSLGNKVFQQFCHYYLWCLYR